jgi:hypothetical protein
VDRRFSPRVVLEAPELVALEGSAVRLNPKQLGILAKQLAKAATAAEAARLKLRLTRSFYGV